MWSLTGSILIEAGQVTLGLLIGFLLYVNNFYGPMRQLATVWASFQMAMAALDRISEVLALESNMPVIPAVAADSQSVLSFRQVWFQYPDGKEVLRDVSFEMERGKAYALVGPTGGGKTTTANLMARLYDPTQGSVLLHGRDIRSYTPDERAQKIGFILQDPFLFSGTVRDNIVYGNEPYREFSSLDLARVLEESNLSNLVSRFPEGLDTVVTTSGNSISLGQKQLIAFMRAALRRPELLILDEATANIDTVTEELLEEILNKLPATTTRVIIAHRLNTIDNVDQIFFVNSGEITLAGSIGARRGLAAPRKTSELTRRHESDRPPRHVGRLRQGSDGVEHFPELIVVFELHILNLAQQLLMTDQHFAHPDESTHDRDIDLHRPLAGQNRRQHGHSLFGKRIRFRPAQTPLIRYHIL